MKELKDMSWGDEPAHEDESGRMNVDAPAGDENISDELYNVTVSVGHLTEQLGVLLEDISNTTLESENHIVSNIRILNGNLERLCNAVVANGVVTAGSVNLKPPVAKSGAIDIPTDEAVSLRAELEILKAAVAEQGDQNRKLIVEEIRRFRDHMLVISMARVADEDGESFETYNEILLSEIRALREDMRTLDPDAVAAALAAAPVVEYRPAVESVAPAAPAPAPAVKAPPKAKRTPAKAPAPVKPRKVITPVAGNDLTINEILNKISATEVKP